MQRLRHRLAVRVSTAIGFPVLALPLILSLADCGGPTPPSGGANGEAATKSGDRTYAVETVVGKTWHWVGTVTPVETIDVAEPNRYTLALDEGRAAIRFDCNTGGGEYRIAEGQLSFGPLLSTRMACGPESQDAVFSKELAQIRSFFVEDGKLYLEMPMDAGTMQFESTGAQE